jgi:hypothetical protein
VVLPPYRNRILLPAIVVFQDFFAIFLQARDNFDRRPGCLASKSTPALDRDRPLLPIFLPLRETVGANLLGSGRRVCGSLR